MEKDKMNIDQKIKIVNQIVMSEPYFDFEISKMNGVDLILVGSKDFTYSHTLELVFKDVFRVSMNAKWSVDTKDSFISILTDKEQFDYNVKFDIEQGNVVFAFAAEGFSSAFYIVSKDIEFNTDVVLYYKKEELQPGERLADWV